MGDIKPSHKGLLHKAMGISKSKKIPSKKLAKEKKVAKKTGNKKLMKQVVYAQNVRK